MTGNRIDEYYYYYLQCLRLLSRRAEFELSTEMDGEECCRRYFALEKMATKVKWIGRRKGRRRRTLEKASHLSVASFSLARCWRSRSERCRRRPGRQWHLEKIGVPKIRKKVRKVSVGRRWTTATREWKNVVANSTNAMIRLDFFSSLFLSLSLSFLAFLTG